MYWLCSSAPIFWIASSSPRWRVKPYSVPPVPLVKSSTGLSLKIAFTSLNNSTIIGMNSARPPPPMP